MYRMFDFLCLTPGCMYENRTVERLVGDSEDHNALSCEHCSEFLLKVLSATAGFVPGTKNPCKIKKSSS